MIANVSFDFTNSYIHCLFPYIMVTELCGYCNLVPGPFAQETDIGGPL